MNIFYTNTPAEEFPNMNVKVDTSDFLPFDLAAFEAAEKKPTLYTRSGLPVRLSNTAINEVFGASQSRTDKNYNGKCIVGVVYRPTYKKWKLNSWYANGKDAQVPGWDLMMKPSTVINYTYTISYTDVEGTEFTINSTDSVEWDHGKFKAHSDAATQMLHRCNNLIMQGCTIVHSEILRKETKTI